MNKQLLKNVDTLEQAIADTVEYQIGDYTPKPDMSKVVVLQSDGIYEVRENSLGVFIIKVSNHSFEGLQGSLKEGFTLKIPKIPQSKYYELLSFYRMIYDKYKSEVYVSLYYDPNNDKWHFYVPTQTVSGALVEYKDHTPEILELEKEWIHVLETHSHNTMTGRFSSIDDSDQQECDVLHMVIGDIFSDNPSFSIRFAHGDKKVYVNIDKVFDFHVNMDINYDILFPEWNTRISKRQPLKLHTPSSYTGLFPSTIVEKNEDYKPMTDKELEEFVEKESNFTFISGDENESFFETDIYKGYGMI